MSLYAGTTELKARFQQVPNLPVPPRHLDDVVAHLIALNRAIVDAYSQLAKRLPRFVEVAEATDFGAAVTVVAVIFGSNLADATYQVLATPSWNTKIWVTAVVASGFTINASDAPGGAGGTVRWAVVS